MLPCHIGDPISAAVYTEQKCFFFFCMKRRRLDIPSVDLANSKAIVCEVERATEFGNLQHCLVRFGDLAVGHMMPLNSFTLTSFHIADIFFCEKFWMRFPKKIFLENIFILWLTGTNSLWTVSKITAPSGGSVTIPCHYHRLHKDLPKFWYKGKNWFTCLRLQPTNQGKRPAISFYNSPDELVTTMTMTNLRSSDSNRYWCAVKTQGSFVRTSLELTVTEGK